MGRGLQYFNGTAAPITTESSIFVSSSKCLTNTLLRALVAEELLRRSGWELTATANIPQVSQNFHDTEDMRRFCVCSVKKRELAAFFFRIINWLHIKEMMKAALHYSEVFKVQLDADDMGAAQGRNWKIPLLMLPWRDLIDWTIEKVRTEYGMTNVPPPSHWVWSNDVFFESAEKYGESWAAHV